MARKRRPIKETEFDLTPMIDVTFQLLIFFLVAMKMKQIERRQGTDLPQDSGPAPTQAEPQDFIVLRTFWRGGTMTYEVNFKHGNNEGKGAGAIHAPTLQELIEDRSDPSNSKYTGVFNALVEKLENIANKVPKAKAVELAIAPNTQLSSAAQVPDTAPWGFVTLAVDACTKFNQNRKANNLEPMALQIKNTQPEGITKKS